MRSKFSDLAATNATLRHATFVFIPALGTLGNLILLAHSFSTRILKSLGSFFLSLSVHCFLFQSRRHLYFTYPYIRSAASFPYVKFLSFLISRHLISFFFLQSLQQPDWQEAPTTKPLRQAICPPNPTEHL